ncbi:unnamed protein product [Polarella glacialis]|uniref:Poly [ADP-ribose] polymerase n=1 Tax=Polarella glacialis TaxID=89957 RepID=A0A813KQ72_POLGL|nr:unnamed protein product [Polarella glacialis]
MQSGRIDSGSGDRSNAAHRGSSFRCRLALKLPENTQLGMGLLPQTVGAHCFPTISTIDAASWAEQQGLQIGDRLISVNDLPMSDYNCNDFWNLLYTLPGPPYHINMVFERYADLWPDAQRCRDQLADCQEKLYSVEDIPSVSPQFQLLSQLVVSTTAKHRRQLRSNEFCEEAQLEVLGVRAVCNPRLQKLYIAKLEHLEGKRRQGCSPILPFQHLKLPMGMGEADLNEHLCFHGAPTAVVDKICKAGFSPCRAGETTGAIFGTASYFALNSSKADDYTEDRAQPRPKQARRTLVVARVLLGESHRTTGPMQDARRPPDGADGNELDSVWAEDRQNGGCVDHREVMVYSEAQALPIALVDYMHKESCCCAGCCKRPAGS